MSSSKQTDILRAIKALRRSIKGEEKAKAHVSIGPKSAVAIVPPKKVRSLQPIPKALCVAFESCRQPAPRCAHLYVGTMGESGPWWV